MPSPFELATIEGLSKQCWLSKHEHRRFRRQCLRWRKENPKANVLQEKLYEDILRNHLLIQRLIDKRMFFDGSPTTYLVDDGRKTSDIDDEDSKRKAKEFEHWYPILMRIESDLLKLALAEKIEITGDVLDIASLVTQYRKGKDGESANNGDRCGGCRIP